MKKPRGYQAALRYLAHLGGIAGRGACKRRPYALAAKAAKARWAKARARREGGR